ncbi:trypco2 family protein [Streptomyces sp. GESEQ-35]|uniref:trypco2 family protein n=1 Tax=Streptomyces sp. GESEQ-35 TaxID=2812657 RepID=UPI001B32E24F|nr:trypco2 family protein [Streptomyces sp. GESEQ-35]
MDGHAIDGIDLADAIASVRDQLIEATTRATGQPVSFEVGPIDMEFTVELRKETKGSGKVRAWVAEAGADTARSTGRTHRIAFTLTPRDSRTDTPWQVGNDDRGSTAGFGDDDRVSSAGLGNTAPVPVPAPPAR